MIEKQPSNENYQKGFNEGYVISKHMPELSEHLAEIKSDSIRMEGFRDGKNEFNIEKSKEHLPGWLKKDALSKKDIPDKPVNKEKREHDKDK